MKTLAPESNRQPSIPSSIALARAISAFFLFFSFTPGVADAIDGQGNKHTIWRNPGELAHLTNGSVVELAIDSKGKVSLIDREPQPRAMGFSTEQPY